LRPWVGGALWVCLEHIRSVILTGFPWALLSHTQVHNLPIIQIASITGAPGISFIIVAVNLALADFICPPRAEQANTNVPPHVSQWGGEEGLPSYPPRCETRGGNSLSWYGATSPTRPAVVLLVIGICFLFGFWRIKSHANTPNTPTLNVALLQGNIDQYKKWDATYELDIRNQYAKLARQAAQTHPDVIIWPESAVPGWFPNDPFYAQWVKEVVQKTKTFNIVGACTTKGDKAFNSAFLIGPDGEIKAEYAKMKLVPFGEYIPFGGVFKRWIPYLGELGTFEAGQEGVAMPIQRHSRMPLAGIHGSPIKAFGDDEEKIYTNICYEAIFDGIIRSHVNNGADLLVNLTNDGWFLNTGAPEQHFNANILRAVENARPVVRAANTGISGAIDPMGRVLLRTPLMESGAFAAQVPLAGNEKTCFTRFGNWFTWACWLILVGAGGLSLNQAVQIFFPIRKKRGV
jgi:apolipoprotein N-acyltransferase